MKVLVSTYETQGDDPGDFNWVPVGELVARYGMVCSREQPDGQGGCGCGRSFSGLTDPRGTTSAVVVERDITEADWRVAVHEALRAYGWADDESLVELAEMIDEMVEDDLYDVEDYPAGTVLGRRAWMVDDDLFDHLVVRRPA